MTLRKISIALFMLSQLINVAWAQNKESASSGFENLYIYESDGNNFNTKTYFYDTGTEVVAFDTQFTGEAAQKAIEFLHGKTKNPLTYAIITHPNPDKFNGASVFKKEGAKIIASDETAQNLPKVHAYKKYYFVNIAKMFTEENYPVEATIDMTFKDEYAVPLKNGGKVILKELHLPGVSTNQTVAYIPLVKTLIVGDLVHHQVHSWLEGPIVEGATQYSTKNWIKTLKEIEGLYPVDTMVYGGRGTSANLKDAVSEQAAYLEKAQTIVKNYVDSLEGDTLKDKKNKVNYEDLTELFKEEFPDYGLSYMITYGAYGLVNSL